MNSINDPNKVSEQSIAMELTLHALISHKLFDWSCRSSKDALASNLEAIVKDIAGLRQVDTVLSPPLFKTARDLYDLIRKKKNAGIGKYRFMEREFQALKSYEVKLEVTEGEEKEEEREEVVKEKVERGRRKFFDELLSKKMKQARVDKVIKILNADVGLETGVVEHLKQAEEESLRGELSEKEETFKMCCLNLMKTLSLSETKFDDLRWWIFDIIKRGFDLATMPASSTLRAKVKKEMLPSDMQSSETGAEFDIYAALFHTGQRFLKRPDIQQHLKEGDTVKHLAKIGSDFATGFGKIQQKKESDFDEDGSHNTGFQSLKLARGEDTLFVNKCPGGSELLRLVSKTAHKDTVEKMVMEMNMMDKLSKEVPKQDVCIEGVGLVHVEHHLVNSLHDGKERLAMTQHKV